MKPVHFLSHLLFFALLSVVGAEEKKPAAAPADGAAALEALERKILYHPRKYGRADIAKFTAAGGQRLDYRTAQGAQCAWFLPPAKPAADGRLWIVCGGNGTLALEMAGFCRHGAFPADGWVLIDYPGYGECAGAASPAGIRENVKAAVPLAAGAMKLEAARLPQRACVLGHSLGCAAALLAVEEFKVQRALLLAPFTSTRDMASERFALPATVPLQHLFDNRAGLRVLAAGKGQCCIFHGTSDEVIPVDMSERLAKEFPAAVKLRLVPGGRHNDLARKAAAEIAKAMSALRGPSVRAAGREIFPLTAPGTCGKRALMNCPRCHTALSGAKHETGIAWRCAACGGQTLNFSQFRKLIPEPRANRIWETVMEKPARPRTKSLCPECGRDMAAVFMPAGEQTLELDICRNCQRLWLDSAARSGHALPGEQEAVPAPPPRPMGAAQERLATQIMRRRLISSAGYEIIGRLTLGGILLYVTLRLMLKVLGG